MPFVDLSLIILSALVIVCSLWKSSGLVCVITADCLRWSILGFTKSSIECAIVLFRISGGTMEGLPFGSGMGSSSVSITESLKVGVGST